MAKETTKLLGSIDVETEKSGKDKKKKNVCLIVSITIGLIVIGCIIGVICVFVRNNKNEYENQIKNARP